MWDEDELEDKSTEQYTHAYPCKKTLLTPIQEIDLCHKAQNGDEFAREQMILYNLRLVIRIATRYRGKSLSLEDMVQEGIIGLMTAVVKFDGTKGYKFSTYATYWIRQAIVRSLEKKDRKIRIPAYLCQMERQVRQAEHLLFSQLGREPTQEEVLEEIDLPARVMRMIDYLQPEPLSLDVLMGAEQDVTLTDLLVDEGIVNPEAMAMQQFRADEMRELIGGLKEREQIVIERRFGFHDGSVWTLAELARLLGVSREAIRQIEKRALNRLRILAAKREEEP